MYYLINICGKPRQTRSLRETLDRNTPGQLCIESPCAVNPRAYE
jgi:hypothetical protein